jgi:hypothetical protein
MIIYIRHLCDSAVVFCQRRGVASDNASVVVRDIGHAIAPFVGPAAYTHTHTHAYIYIYVCMCVYTCTRIIVGACVFCVRTCVC